MPALAQIIIQVITAALTEAPEVVSLVTKAKEFIVELVKAGIIPAEHQDRTFAYVDAACKAALAGEIPPALQVQPDPES